MDKSKKQVGIFQANWPLQTQTFNAALVLAESGYGVDLFLYETVLLVNLDILIQNTNIHLHNYSENDLGEDSTWFYSKLQTIGLIEKVFLFIKRRLQFYKSRFSKKDVDKKPIPQEVYTNSRHIVSKNNYVCFIGVEKAGLVWAGMLGEEKGIPFIYSNLELYTWDHPEIVGSPSKRFLKREEEKYHKLASATIVQDKIRAEILFRDNQMSVGETILVPVSLLSEPIPEPSYLPHSRCGISEQQIILLQFGIISETRFSFLLAEVAQTFPDSWTLLFHGYGSRKEIKRVKKFESNSKVCLSTERLNPEEIPAFVQSATIGLVFYRPFPQNDRFTVFSSEKLALYLLCGLPVITFDYEGYEFLEQQGCGVNISDFNELIVAVNRILANYEQYSRNARSCFENYYDFRKNYSKVIDYIGGINPIKEEDEK